MQIRIRIVVAWTLSMMLAFMFAIVAFPKIMGQPGWLQRFSEWGYSGRFAGGIGMLELVGAAMLLFPSLAAYGATLLAVVMLGAIWTHFSTGIGSPAFAFQMLLLTAAVIALRFPDARGLARPRADTVKATSESNPRPPESTEP